MTIGERIKRVRRANKMSLKAFGSELGVADRTVMNWEKNNSGVPFEMAIQICQKFGCTLNWLAGIKEESQEKQIPKKPQQQGAFDNHGVFHTWNGINGRPYLLCPSCGMNLCCEMPGDRKPRYCKGCGQKLDWN